MKQKTTLVKGFLQSGGTDETNLDTTFLNPSMGFSCKKCEFVGKNEGGLKTHVKKKHKGYDNNI